MKATGGDGRQSTFNCLVRRRTLRALSCTDPSVGHESAFQLRLRNSASASESEFLFRYYWNPSLWAIASLAMISAGNVVVKEARSDISGDDLLLDAEMHFLGVLIDVISIQLSEKPANNR